MNISEIIDEGENVRIEFKESMSEGAYKSISAFSNTEGGALLCGVSDEGQIVGMDCSDEPVRNITTRIVNKMGIHPSINCLEIDGNNILRIDIEKSNNPISYNGRYYKRVGSTTGEMLGDELKSFFLRDTNWDALTGDYSISEIDEETLQKFLKRSIDRGRLLDEHITNVKEILIKLNLIIDDKITNAAIILFGKNPQKYFINAVIRVSSFKDDRIISDKTIGGNLFNQAEQTEEILKNIMGVEYVITDKLSRDDIWDYPLTAVRESLLNAIIHRDYFKFGIQTQIKIHEDNMWIFNPGGLLNGLTIDNIKIPHPSKPRNPLITDIFFRAGYVEVLGSGINRILSSFKVKDLPEPEFKEEFDGFSVYMFKGLTEDILKSWDVNERQIKAILYLNKKESISTEEFSKMVPEISLVTARRDLKDLVDKRILKTIGSQKKRRYELV